MSDRDLRLRLRLRGAHRARRACSAGARGRAAGPRGCSSPRRRGTTARSPDVRGPSQRRLRPYAAGDSSAIRTRGSSRAGATDHPVHVRLPDRRRGREQEAPATIIRHAPEVVDRPDQPERDHVQQGEDDQPRGAATEQAPDPRASEPAEDLCTGGDRGHEPPRSGTPADRPQQIERFPAAARVEGRRSERRRQSGLDHRPASRAGRAEPYSIEFPGDTGHSLVTIPAYRCRA